MILGFLSVGAVIYGLGVIMRGAFITPIAHTVVRVAEEYTKTVEQERSARYRPGEGLGSEKHTIVFGNNALFALLADYLPEIVPWLDKTITFTDSEMDDFRELFGAVHAYVNAVGHLLQSDRLTEEQKQSMLEPSIQPLLTFLERMHPSRLEIGIET